MKKSLLLIQILSIILCSCKLENNPSLSMIIDSINWDSNFSYNVLTTFPNREDTTSVISIKSNYSYYKRSDTIDNYNYHVNFYSYENSDILSNTLIFDGINYLRLNHERKDYVLGDNSHKNINSFWGHIFAIKHLLEFANKNDSSVSTISIDKKKSIITIEIDIRNEVFLDIPISIRFEEEILFTKFVILLDANNYFPISIIQRSILKNSKSNEFIKHEFCNLKTIQFKSIVAIDSIPSDYKLMIMESNKTLLSMIGHQFPYFSLKSIKNKVVSASDYNGKLILYDFFALYRGPCKMATKDLILIKEQFQQNIEIISIDVMKKSEVNKLIEYEKLKSINYLILTNGFELKEKLGIESIPTFILVDAKNNILSYYIGYSKEIMNSIQLDIENELNHR